MESRIFSYLMGTAWCITYVYASTNLALRGNTVTGETFQLVCSSTPNDQGLTTFSIFRSSSSGSIGTNLGTFGYSPSNSPACHDRGIDPFSYPFGCEEGGRKGYINITVPTDNVDSLTEHNTYWRCATLTAPATAENNVVHISIIVHASTNLGIRGNTVIGETFQLVCSSTPNDQGLTTFSFFRSSSSRSIGTNLGIFGYSPSKSPSCHDRGFNPFPYTFGCEEGGRKGYVNITVPTDNVDSLTEHNTYWRCVTLTDTTAADNNVVHVSIIVPITGISLISPAVGTDNTVILTENVPTTFQCRTTQGRPAAYVTWYLDNVLLSGGTTSTAPVTGDIVTTTGTLTLTVDRTADGKVLSCSGTNYVNMIPVQSTRNPVLKMKCKSDMFGN